MKYRKFTRQEKKENRQENVRQALAGGGVYLFENRAGGELKLPRPTKSGRREIGVKEQFQGDSYFLQMVRSGELKLVSIIQTPEQEQDALLKEQTMNEERLICDQPDRVTTQGRVESVVQNTTPARPLRESGNQPAEDVLLNEGPVDGGFVIVDDDN